MATSLFMLTKYLSINNIDDDDNNKIIIIIYIYIYLHLTRHNNENMLPATSTRGSYCKSPNVPDSMCDAHTVCVYIGLLRKICKDLHCGAGRRPPCLSCLEPCPNRVDPPHPIPVVLQLWWTSGFLVWNYR